MRNHFVPWVATLIMLTASAGDATGQTSYVTRVGASLTDFNGGSVGATSERVGFAAGLHLLIKLTSRISIESGADLVQKGVSFARLPLAPNAIRAESFSFGYIEIPLLIRVASVDQPIAPHMSIGPSLAFLVSCSLALRETVRDGSGRPTGTRVVNQSCSEAKTDISALDIGASVGVGLTIDDRFGAELRYGVGFRSIDGYGIPSEAFNESWLLLLTLETG